MRGQDSSRRDDGIGFLGRLQRQKVRISRKHILESAIKVFELYGSSSSILEVEYFEEVGTGLGPTLEFYSLVSREFARKDLKIWRDSNTTETGVYVNHPLGLYPAPLHSEECAGEAGQYVLRFNEEVHPIDIGLEKGPISSALSVNSLRRLCSIPGLLTYHSTKCSSNVY